MGLGKRFRSFAFPAILAGCASAPQRHPAGDPVVAPVQQLSLWETQANAVSRRSSEQIALEHYEIPLRLLHHDFAKNLDPGVRDALLFERDGETYARWLINPEDTKWYLEVEKWLESKGVSTQRHRHLLGWMTASRSYVVRDPKTGATFSAKMSTNSTGGKWQDKKVDLADSKQVRMLSDYIQDVESRVHLDHLRFLPEPLLLGIEDIDQAVITRSLDVIAHGDDHYLLPAFSALHETVGREIAEANGSTNPATFWREHLFEPLGDAVAELVAHFGMTPESPHGQNILIELDAKKRPTGRIYLRDIGDMVLINDYFEGLGAKNIVDAFNPNSVFRRESIAVGNGLLSGNEWPAWMSATDYQQSQQAFFKRFEKRLAERVGLQAQPLHETRFARSAYAGAAQKIYDYSDTKDPGWAQFFRNARCTQGKAPRHLCPETLQKQLRIDAQFAPRTQSCRDLVVRILREAEEI